MMDAGYRLVLDHCLRMMSHQCSTRACRAIVGCFRIDTGAIIIPGWCRWGEDDQKRVTILNLDISSSSPEPNIIPFMLVVETPFNRDDVGMKEGRQPLASNLHHGVVSPDGERI